MNYLVTRMSLEVWSVPGLGCADGRKMVYAKLSLPFATPGINRRVKPVEVPSLHFTTTSHTCYCSCSLL